MSVGTTENYQQKENQYMIKILLSNLPLMNCLDRGLFLYERNSAELQRTTKRSQFKKKKKNEG